MNEKINDRIAALESSTIVFNIPETAINEVQGKIRNGSLLYGSSLLNHSDSSTVIYNTIMKNCFFLEKDIAIIKKHVERYNDIKETVELLNTFVDNYSKNTEIMISTLIDWANSYGGNYVYYDSMIYDSMTSSYSGWFDSNYSNFSFGDITNYEKYFGTSKMTIEVYDGTKLIASNNGDYGILVNYSTTNKELSVKVSFVSQIMNYGMCVRSNVYYTYNNELYKSHDKYPLNFNFSETYKVSGILDGSLYKYDFGFTIKPFYSDGNQYSYISNDIDFSSISNNVKIDVDYSSNYVYTYLVRKTESNEFESIKSINSGTSILETLVDSEILYDKTSGTSGVEKIIFVGTDFGYRFDNFVSSKNKSNYSFEDLLYGLNCMKDTKQVVNVDKNISISGEYTYNIDDLFTDKENDKIDILATIKTSVNPSITTMKVAGLDRDVYTFSIFGKAKNIYVSEKNIYYKYTGDSSSVDDILSEQNKYFMIYDSSTNTTTIVTTKQCKPDFVVYNTSVYDLISKSGYTIESATISTDYTYFNYNIFGSDPENSMFLISDTGFVKNSNFTDVSNIYNMLVEDNVRKITLNIQMELIRRYEHNVYECSLFSTETKYVKFGLNTGLDNLIGRKYTVNNNEISTFEIQKYEDTKVKIVGDINYAISVLKTILSSNDVFIYSGDKMTYSTEKVSDEYYRIDMYNNEYFLILNKNLSIDITSEGSLLPLTELSYSPIIIFYRNKMIGENIKYSLKLISPYNGYTLNNIKIFGGS